MMENQSQGPPAHAGIDPILYRPSGDPAARDGMAA